MYPYRKNTIIVSNIDNLELKKCENNCDMCINGRHMVTGGYYNNNLYGTKMADYHSELKRIGAYPRGHTTTDKLHEVPVLLLEYILTCVFGM